MGGIVNNINVVQNKFVECSVLAVTNTCNKNRANPAVNLALIDSMVLRLDWKDSIGIEFSCGGSVVYWLYYNQPECKVDWTIEGEQPANELIEKLRRAETKEFYKLMDSEIEKAKNMARNDYKRIIELTNNTVES